MAGDTLFFKLIFRDKSGAIIDQVDDINSLNIIIKKDGYEGT